VIDVEFEIEVEVIPVDGVEYGWVLMDVEVEVMANGVMVGCNGCSRRRNGEWGAQDGM